MTRRNATKRHRKVKRLAAQMAHGVSWFGVPATAPLALTAGYALGWGAAEDQSLQANFVSMTFMLSAVVFAFSAAPEPGQLAAAFSGP